MQLIEVKDSSSQQHGYSIENKSLLPSASHGQCCSNILERFSKYLLVVVSITWHGSSHSVGCTNPRALPAFHYLACTTLGFWLCNANSSSNLVGFEAVLTTLGSKSSSGAKEKQKLSTPQGNLTMFSVVIIPARDSPFS